MSLPPPGAGPLATARASATDLQGAMSRWRPAANARRTSRCSHASPERGCYTGAEACIFHWRFSRTIMTTNLFNKVWDQHTVGTLPSGQPQLFIGLHLIHEVTSPQAF